MSHLNSKGLTSILGSLVTAAFLFTFLSQPVIAADANELYSISRGGKLYDMWWHENGNDEPSATHKAWPNSNTKKKGGVTWRCKSCHGWDYIGKDGLYSKGSYKTGIKGISGSAGAAPTKIAAIIRDTTHGYTYDMLDEDDVTDLANFVSKGQIDVDKYLDRATKKPIGGNAVQGKIYFDLVCSGCHEKTGTKPKDLPDTLGKLTNKNPWEIINKIQNGQPGESMPSMMGFDMQVTVDIIAHLRTLQLEFD